MQIVKEKKVCIICGKEEEYSVLLSNFINGAPDLDLKPNGSMASLGMEIQQCPHCGYCNYDISETIQSRFAFKCNNPLELWQNYDEVQEILKSNKNEALKKYLVMAEQFKGDLNNKKAYQMLLKASWVADTKEQAKELMKEAYNLFVEEMLPDIRNQLFQVVDIARQIEYFDQSKAILDACNNIIDENYEDAETLEKIVKYQTKLIENKDSQRHNLSEIN
ncbi:MAG: hypothetical protein E7376_04525 [Clostridiales bacterium]|nr:hypothetical protein [Clostridiales bacterium]